MLRFRTDSSAEAALKDNAELSATFGTPADYPGLQHRIHGSEMGSVDAIAMDVIVAGYQIEQRGESDKYVILDEDPFRGVRH